MQNGASFLWVSCLTLMFYIVCVFLDVLTQNAYVPATPQSSAGSSPHRPPSAVLGTPRTFALRIIKGTSGFGYAFFCFLHAFFISSLHIRLKLNCTCLVCYFAFFILAFESFHS